MVIKDAILHYFLLLSCSDFDIDEFVITGENDIIIVTDVSD